MQENNFKEKIETLVEDKKIRGGRGVAVPVPFRRFDTDLPVPSKEEEGNAGFDLFARLNDGEEIVIQPGEYAMIPLNLATEIPFGIVGLLFQRSSTYKKWGIKLTNGVGVIDAIFSGDGDEWQGQFKNETTLPVMVRRGDKICQALFIPLAPVALVEVDKLGNPDRGGFGTSFDNATAR